jgi:hypothetical protein
VVVHRDWPSRCWHLQSGTAPLPDGSGSERPDLPNSHATVWRRLLHPPGSAKSDLDFLVSFEDVDLDQYADVYFGLLEDLRAVFQRPVDIVMDSAIRNPHFREAVDSTRTLIYEA